MSNTRMPWDIYFLKMAFLASERSTCVRRHVGAVIVSNNQVLATGYNGACKGVRDCLDLGCLRNLSGISSGEHHEICRAVHAEQNAIIQAAVHGTAISGATLYCTHSPCVLCAKMIVNANIKRCVFGSMYSEEVFRGLFDEAKIEYKYIPFEEVGHVHSV